MRKHPAKTADVDVEALGKSLDSFVEAKAATRKDGSIRALIHQLRPRLLAARSRGITYAELTAWLSQQGIVCGESTVRTYMSAEKRSSKRARKPASRAAPAVKTRPKSAAPSTAKAPPKGFKVIDDNEL